MGDCHVSDCFVREYAKLSVYLRWPRLPCKLRVEYFAALEDAMPSLKPDRIAGVGGLATRHDSMSAGEMGADYVLFGEPDAAGQRPSMQAIAERLDWWAELFEPPCVGFATSPAEAFEFAAAGADFVLVGDFIWADPRGAMAALSDAEAAIKKAYADAPAGRGHG